MRILFGFLLIAAAIVLGAYVGFWVMFVGGIMSLYNMIQSDTLTAFGLGKAILRIMFSGALGWITFFVFWSFGLNLIKKRPKKG